MSDKIDCPLCGHSTINKMALVHTSVRECTAADCRLQFAVPQLDDETLARAYEDLYYPKNGHEVQYENTTQDIVRQMFRRMETQFGSLQGLRLLDYGCGRGHLLGVAREFGFTIDGIELDPVARACAAAIPNVSVYANIDDLQIAEATAQFDVITLWTVIEHLRIPWCDMDRLRKVLRPGGRMFISTMDVRCMRARVERKRWSNYRNPTHLYYFDRKSLARAIRKSGFSELSEWKLSLQYPHHGILRRLLHKISSAFGISDGLFYLCKEDRKSNEGKHSAYASGDDETRRGVRRTDSIASPLP